MSRRYNTAPPTEYASGAGHGLDGLRSLSAITGLELETVAALGFSKQLSKLFGPDGKLRDGVELRSMEQAGQLRPAVEQRSTTQQKIAKLYGMRWPDEHSTPGKSPAGARAELIRMRYPKPRLTGRQAVLKLLADPDYQTDDYDGD